jgi:hypothetical protein
LGGFDTTFASTGTVTLGAAAVEADIVSPFPPRSPDFGFCGTPVWDRVNRAWFDGCRWGYNNGWYVAPPLVSRF